MHLEDQRPRFSKISHHANVTQCLGAIGGHVWYLGVSKPSLVEEPDFDVAEPPPEVVQSRWGHFYVHAPVDEVHFFRISGVMFLKLNRGTWHAGPLFNRKSMVYNLELSNTDAVDVTNHYFIDTDNVKFVLDE
ncbi:OLC1v1025935C1 [Oldenlandia corymbosa var. corymbosa]|uniref:OLC1v1025935C1 n=1 Tax=Oldenlandia corymbosa var. corymbosa TaxID=529605 RepID=A0AAV1C8X5_OLDCO|nr:OLC1v1025935C1 [Oldenlandia corymbosa var. corymbosa]